MNTNREEIEKWISGQSWYQTIELSNGLTTPGNVSVGNRLPYLTHLSLAGKSFIDIGCNSGGYALWAKKKGASRVYGVDINELRIKQAKQLSEFESLNIDFEYKSIFDLSTDEKFDVVFCISVLTEISDFFGALHVIKTITKETAILELALAKPLLYLSKSRKWRKGYKSVSRMDAVMELHESKSGYMIAPTLGLLKSFFGKEFTMLELGEGERYTLIQINKIK